MTFKLKHAMSFEQEIELGEALRAGNVSFIHAEKLINDNNLDADWVNIHYEAGTESEIIK